MNLLSQQTWMYILKDILIELKYLPIALAAGILIGGVLLVFSRNRRRAFLSILCIIYFVMIFIITIFEREPGSRTGISLTLFETLGGPHDNAYVIENILLFIPFGFLVPKMWKRLSETHTGLRICWFLSQPYHRGNPASDPARAFSGG